MHMPVLMLMPMPLLLQSLLASNEQNAYLLCEV